MLKEQGGVCKICGTDKPWSRSGKFTIDHDHATGRVRGLLCHNCNLGLGKFKDSIEFLRKAMEYLS
jgi:hypothetical protein